MAQKKTRKPSLQIDTLRGVACILLVFYHVVGGNSASGLRLGDGSSLQAFNQALAYVRMPLFTFLSGVVYALRPVSAGVGQRFTRGKVRRLLLPFIFVSIIFAATQKLTPGTNASLSWSEIPLTLIWPYAHLWFIAALMLIFVVIGTLDYMGMIKHPFCAMALFALSCGLFELHYGATGVFGWNRALYLLPFFCAGLVLTRFGLRWALACVLLALVSPGLQISLGVAASLALLLLMPAVHFLAQIGTYSYSIFLFHVFGAAASRIGLRTIGVEEVSILVISGTIAGLVVPIVIHLGLSRVPYLSIALLGIPTRKSSSR